MEGVEVMEREYELKLADGRVVKWVGFNEVNAAERYVDLHRDEIVVAVRQVRWGFFPGVSPEQVIG